MLRFFAKSLTSLSLTHTHEVWGTVMFLHTSVILSTGSLCMMSLPVWLPGPMFLLGVSVFGPMLILGVSVWDVTFQRTPRRPPRNRDPTFGKEPALRNLLECAIVLCKFVAYEIKSPNINSISKCIRLSFC